MIKKYLLISFALILSVITVSGCSVEQETEKREISGLDELGVITVVSREEGSGTRNVFAESLDFFDDAISRYADDAGGTKQQRYDRGSSEFCVPGGPGRGDKHYRSCGCHPDSSG